MRKKLLGLFFGLIGASAAFGQGGQFAGGGVGSSSIPFAGVPSGSCAATQNAVNTLTGDYYSCNGAAWLKVGPGAAGSAAFNTITTGVNSSATMTVGTGASIVVTGSGTVNATAMSYAGLSSFPAACGANLFATAIGATLTCTQPAFSNLSGSLTLAQTPLTTTQDLLYDNAGSLTRLPIVTSGNCLGNTGGVWASLACSGGSGTITSGTTNTLPKYTAATTIGNSLLSDNATTLSYTGTGGMSSNGPVSVVSDGVHPGDINFVGNTTVVTPATNTFNLMGPSVVSFTAYALQASSTGPSAAGVLHNGAPSSTVSQVTYSPVVGADMTNNTVTATQLAAQYSKGQCTELWGGSGASFALTAGDDAISNNSCYNDSGVTRTITAVKCRSDIASNTTTANPTFGSAGTGTTILSGALTCGSSLAYSSSGTVSNASWTTGTGINPVMGGTLTGTSIALLVEYTF